MSRKGSVMKFLHSKLQAFKFQPPALLCVFLKFWKIPEIKHGAYALEFLFTEAGANRFSTE